MCRTRCRSCRCTQSWRRSRKAFARAGYGFRRTPPPEGLRSEIRLSADRRVGDPDLRCVRVNILKAGQAHTEYAVILVLIGITVIGALTLLGQSVHEMWRTITAAMPR